jgi:hypothetical protein
MKMSFNDTLKKEAFALDISFGEEDSLNYECNSMDIKWTLSLEVEQFGISSFQYQLDSFKTRVSIENEIENSTILEDFNIEVKFYDNKAKDGYYCRIYEDKIVDNKWVEKELAIFPIEIKVDETPIDHTNGRSQIYCKFIDLNINTNNSKLELSI